MLVRAQPSQLTPRSSSRSRMPVSHTGDAGSNPARGFLHALGRVWRCGSAVSRVRRVRSPSRALLAVAQRTEHHVPTVATGVRLLPARLRRKASSEPSGCEPVEQGATPWRRVTTTGRLGRHRSDTAGTRGSIPRSSIEPRRLSSGCREAWPSRRFREPEIAGSTPAGQTCAVEEWLSSRAS
jgi:hypothetical protein